MIHFFDENTSLIVGLNQIDTIGNKSKLIGKYVTKSRSNGKTAIVNDAQFVESQPNVCVVSILSPLTAINENIDLTNELFDILTKTFKNA